METNSIITVQCCLINNLQRLTQTQQWMCSRLPQPMPQPSMAKANYPNTINSQSMRVTTTIRPVPRLRLSNNNWVQTQIRLPISLKRGLHKSQLTPMLPPRWCPSQRNHQTECTRNWFHRTITNNKCKRTIWCMAPTLLPKQWMADRPLWCRCKQRRTILLRCSKWLAIWLLIQQGPTVTMGTISRVRGIRKFYIPSRKLCSRTRPLSLSSKWCTWTSSK